MNEDKSEQSINIFTEDEEEQALDELIYAYDYLTDRFIKEEIKNENRIVYKPFDISNEIDIMLDDWKREIAAKRSFHNLKIFKKENGKILYKIVVQLYDKSNQIDINNFRSACHYFYEDEKLKTLSRTLPLPNEIMKLRSSKRKDELSLKNFFDDSKELIRCIHFSCLCFAIFLYYTYVSK
jgi:hypothetical protein